METANENVFPDWIVNKEGKITRNGNLISPREDADELIGYGAPVSPGVAKKLILNYKKEHIKDDQPLAFTFGKKWIYKILEQDGCGGIRFYLAKERPSDFGQEGDNFKLTLVAIGVKTDNDDIIGNESDIGNFKDGHVIYYNDEKEKNMSGKPVIQGWSLKKNNQAENTGPKLCLRDFDQDNTLIIETVPTWP